MESNPYELGAWEKAYKFKRIIQDERDWMLGLYFRRAIASSFSKENKYPEKSFLSSEVDLATEIDPEANERLAVAEAELWVSLLQKQGELPETIMADLNKETKQ